MSSADFQSLSQVLALLGQHRNWAYLVLFLGAFFETLVPFSLVVYGELFFLPGAMLAGHGVLDLWGVMAVLYSGGLLGDNLSYWLGRRYGLALFERLAAWPVLGRVAHRENYEKGMAFFGRRGALAVFTARLSGPLSWVMPMMAGAFRLDYLTFLSFNTPAVLIGIGEFILAGYLFGDYAETLLVWGRHYTTPVLAVASLASLFLLLRRKRGVQATS